MKHILLFLYIFTIPILVASLVILLMKHKKFAHKEDKFYLIDLFVLTVLLATISDMMVYYSEGYMKIYLTGATWLICDLLYCGIAFVWLQVKINRPSLKAGYYLTRFSRYYFVAYATGIIVVNTSNATVYVVTEYMDYIMVMLLVINMILNLFNTDKTNLVNRIYSFIISSLVVLSYLIYDLKISEIYSLEYINILIWFLISIFTLFMILFRLKTEYISDVENVYYIDESMVFENIKVEYNLTNRESDILKEVYYGKNNQEIAEYLCISENTVKAHVHNLLKKMNLGNKLELVLDVQRRIKRNNEFKSNTSS